MELLGAFSLSDSLTCLAIIMDNEYDASFSVRSVCFLHVSNVSFHMGTHWQGSLHLSPAQPHLPPPSSSGNTISRGVWKKDHIAPG